MTRMKMKILRFIKLRVILLFICPSLCFGFVLALIKRLSVKTVVEEPLVKALPTYLSPLVKQLTSIEQCREWEQVEQHKKRMMDLFRQEDKKNIDMIMELGKIIYSIKNIFP